MNREGRMYSFPTAANENTPREESPDQEHGPSEDRHSHPETSVEFTEDIQAARMASETAQIESVRARLEARTAAQSHGEQVVKPRIATPIAPRNKADSANQSRGLLSRLKFWRKKELSRNEAVPVQEGIALRPFFSGQTAEGTLLEVQEIDYSRSSAVQFTGYKDAFKVSIDGEPLIITAAERFRDGGSTLIRGTLASDGAERVIRLPFMGQPTLDGQPLARKR